MTSAEARTHYNFLFTLRIRKAQSFGPLAFNFIKSQSFFDAGLTPDEQFNLLMATSEQLGCSENYQVVPTIRGQVGQKSKISLFFSLTHKTGAIV